MSGSSEAVKQSAGYGLVSGWFSGKQGWSLTEVVFCVRHYVMWALIGALKIPG
jgi:hypothetical protein